MMAAKQENAEERPGNVLSLLISTGFFGILWRQKFLFLAIFAGLVGIFLAAAILLPARYMATGSVIVAEADPATRISDVWAQKQGDPADLESQVVILRSARILKLALAEPGAYEAAIAECRNAGDSCANLKMDDPKLADRITDNYSIAAEGRSRVLSVSYKSALPETAMTLTNALVTAYLEDQRGSQSSSREVAAKWLWQEITDLDKEIRDRVAKIEAYRRKNGLVQGATASISSESLTSVSQQLAAAEQAKAQAQARLDAIRDIRNGQDIASSPMALENRTVGDLKQQIATLGNQLAASSTVLGPRHPQRRMLEASMAILQKQLGTEIDRISASAEKDYETAAKLVASLEQQVAKAKDNAAGAMSDETAIEGMVRDVDAKRQLYTQLYQRASELESERRSLNGGARLVSLAELPTKPYFPRKTPMLAAGITLGLFFGAAISVLWDRFGGNLRRPANENAAPGRLRSRSPRGGQGLPVIGTLSSFPIPGPAGSREGNLMTAVRRSLLSPAYQQEVKQLSDDLLEAHTGEPLFFTTTDAHARSAALAALLVAQAFAKAGLNVLVIEYAPSSPEFASAFELPQNHPTLGDLIGGYEEPADCVSSTSIPGLHIVAAGEDDGPLLESGRVRAIQRLMAWANPYDLILLSGPSLFSTAAERALPRLAEEIEVRAVVLTSQGEEGETRLADAAAVLAALDIRSAGTILIPPPESQARPADPFARQRRRTA